MEDRMSDSDKLSQEKNEGEGNRTAGRQFNKDEQNFVRSGQVDQKAREAAEALDGDEAKELADAEAIGKRHAAEEDPALKRRSK
jgi:hypothetical protein